MTSNSDSIIRNHAIAAGAAAWIPVPFADVGAIGAVQIDLLRALNSHYSKPWQIGAMKQVLALITVATAGKGAFGSLIKLIPGAGTMIGGSIQFVIASSFTYALGKAYDIHLKTGGEPDSIDAKVFFDNIKKFYTEGKKFAEDNSDEIKEKAKSKKAA